MYKQILRVWRFALVGIVTVLPLTLASNVEATGAIAQGFVVTKNSTSGSLMSLQAHSQNNAEPSSSQHPERLLGVMGSQALLALSDDTDQAQIITSGLTNTLVSDINGAIKAGDWITASPITGVGMKARQSTTVVGVAQADMSKSTTRTVQSLQDKMGKTHQITITSIPVQVQVTYYRAPSEKASTHLPVFWQSVGTTVAGHTVSELRMISGLLVFLLGISTTGVILYAATKSRIIAIGRNPLAEKALRRSILQVIWVAAGILTATLIIVYFVLAT